MPAEIQNAVLKFVSAVNVYLSDYILIFLLVGVGLWYTIKTRFVQARYFGEGLRRVFGNISLRGKKQEAGMSSFQALATALAAQIGTGNIVGASGAILTGGPGAIFWMWVIAFLGMATIYAEAPLAQTTPSTTFDTNSKAPSASSWRAASRAWRSWRSGSWALWFSRILLPNLSKRRLVSRRGSLELSWLFSAGSFSWEASSAWRPLPRSSSRSWRLFS